MIITVNPSGPVRLSTYPRAAGEPFALDPIGNMTVAGIPCPPEDFIWTIEPGFPHLDPPPSKRLEELVRRCWRILLYQCVYHDDSTYVLTDPVILGPRKTAPANPVTAPYRTCSWDYGQNPILTYNRQGEPIYFGPASLNGPPPLTGARLWEIITTAYDTCCAANGGRNVFRGIVPRDSLHHVRVKIAPFFLRQGRITDSEATGQPVYVDTEILEITIDRYDATPRSA